MKIPDGFDEPTVVEMLYSLANRIAPTFRFGYNEHDDMVQEGVMAGIEALESYDKKRGSLHSFLWTHIHNRLYNLKRDKYERPNLPCLDCPLLAYDPHCLKSSDGCTAFSKKIDCELYLRWYKRNQLKKMLVNAAGDECDEQSHDSRLVDRIYGSQIIAYVDKNISNEFRQSWIKLKHNVKLKKSDQDNLLEYLRTILEPAGFYGQ